MRNAILLATASATLLAAPARAHHEAIFGPQSSVLLSEDTFVSAQGFSRRLGGAHAQDTTMLLSAGFSPVAQLPLSIVATVPSHLETGDGHNHFGMDQPILGVRYRLDLTGLQQRFDREGNYVLASVATELPVIAEHDGFGRRANVLGGVLGSVERGAFSLVGFAFGTMSTADAAGSRPGTETFIGGGVAWTPLDGERIASLQLGLSWERQGRDRVREEVVPLSGGQHLILSPTVMVGLTHHWQLFGLFGVPVYSDWRLDAQRTDWRAGLGVLYTFAHDHD